MIIAFDPGGTTGCAMRTDDGAIVTYALSEPNEVYDMIKELAPLRPIIVYERFAAQHISKYGLHTVRIIGGIEAVCRILSLDAYGQMPQMRYPFLQQAAYILAKRKHVVVHEKDALAHLLTWEYRNDNER